SFFKPMLTDKSLSMCQDVTPNTAEARSMMYAITWDSLGKRMIQVGIEPVRLLDELKNNSVSNIVDSMPIYENLQIYVADADGVILGSTDSSGGMELGSAGLDVSAAVPGVISHFHTVVNGRTIGCSVLKDDEYVICVVQDDASTKKETVLSLVMVAAYLLLAAAALLIVIKRLLIIKKEQMDQLMILTSMAGIYYSMHLIDFKSNTLTEYAAHNQVKEVVEKNSAEEPAETIRRVMQATMSEEYLEQGLLFSDVSTLPERLKGRKVIFRDLLVKNVGWIRMSFIAISADADGVPERVICTTQIIDEEKRKEESLIRESTTDQLTRCYNRRAYEKDLDNCPGVSDDEDFVFVSIDVNGLKTVNDSLGHAAGDELLCGAAECMKRCFGGRGKVYRMGGDEFVAIISVSPDKLDRIKADFDSAVCGWSGKIVKSLSVSCGYVTKREFPGYTVTEIARLADERMYSAKAEYYERLHACPR
ncbi:MAG: GGDEF domain-containing protein, partial [Ruminiclostridium sp.]